MVVILLIAGCSVGLNAKVTDTPAGSEEPFDESSGWGGYPSPELSGDISDGRDSGITSSTDPTDGTDTATESMGGTTTDTGMEIRDPPDPVELTATDSTDFDKLSDTNEFTFFSDNGDRVQIEPLRNENFPEDYDWCDAGSDATLNANQQWARAEVIPEIDPWTYDITIDAVTENDGEPTFQLVIDDVVVEEWTAGTTSETFADVTHTLTDVVTSEGDGIEVRSRAVSNLSLTEDGGCRTWSPAYAWARGRWKSLTFTPAKPS